MMVIELITNLIAKRLTGFGRASRSAKKSVWICVGLWLIKILRLIIILFKLHHKFSQPFGAFNRHGIVHRSPAAANRAMAL